MNNHRVFVEGSGSLFDQVSTMKIHQHDITNLIPKMFSSTCVHAYGKSLFVKSPFTQAFFTANRSTVSTVCSHCSHSPQTLSKAAAAIAAATGGGQKGVEGCCLWVFLLMAKNRRFDYVRCLKPCKQRDI